MSFTVAPDIFLRVLIPADEMDWRDRALCAEVDPEAFFPEKGGSVRAAKQVCRGCEVRADCLEYALAHDERFGIWGGFSERERRRMQRALGAGSFIAADDIKARARQQQRAAKAARWQDSERESRQRKRQALGSAA